MNEYDLLANALTWATRSVVKNRLEAQYQLNRDPQQEKQWTNELVWLTYHNVIKEFHERITKQKLEYDIGLNTVRRQLAIRCCESLVKKSAEQAASEWKQAAGEYKAEDVRDIERLNTLMVDYALTDIKVGNYLEKKHQKGQNWWTLPKDVLATAITDTAITWTEWYPTNVELAKKIDDAADHENAALRAVRTGMGDSYELCCVAETTLRLYPELSPNGLDIYTVEFKGNNTAHRVIMISPMDDAIRQMINEMNGDGASDVLRRLMHEPRRKDVKVLDPWNLMNFRLDALETYLNQLATCPHAKWVTVTSVPTMKWATQIRLKPPFDPKLKRENGNKTEKFKEALQKIATNSQI